MDNCLLVCSDKSFPGRAQETAAAGAHNVAVGNPAIGSKTLCLRGACLSVLTKVSQGSRAAAANCNAAVGNTTMGLKPLVRGRLLVCSDKRPGVPWAAAGVHNVAVGVLACLF